MNYTDCIATARDIGHETANIQTLWQTEILGMALCALSRMRLPSSSTVEPRYNENLRTMIITLLYQGKKTKKYKELGPAK